MSLIDGEINPENGLSKYFDVKVLEKLIVENVEDIYHLFMPDFNMQTPLHKLLMEPNFKLFNNLIENINSTTFDAFLIANGEEYINKIKSMFYYTLENIVTYSVESITTDYCDPDYEILSPYDNLTEQDENNIKIFENYCVTIKDLILKEFIHPELFISENV